jgi:hypothetical protein
LNTTTDEAIQHATRLYQQAELEADPNRMERYEPQPAPPITTACIAPVLLPPTIA